MRCKPSLIAWITITTLSACSVTNQGDPHHTHLAAQDGGPSTAVLGALVDPACAGEPVAYHVEPFELGNTGRPARSVVLSGSQCLGPTGQITELWVQFKGEWVSQLKTAGTLMALPTQHQGYPHLTVQDLGNCAPEWRWQGTGYQAFRTCP